ncbi:acid-sensing ion channel 1C [Caerostris darwini]|uniref:Acid-sensing ion channel 1C n=1 Tax=Caerostris darwini TaxID=1538125 RepID=A0AAV4PEV9_9ARAC|nr:acid-sensing ion channel 1C [Caerostris darwini]
MVSTRRIPLTTSDLCKNFASQSTTHGLRRISETEGTIGKLLWTLIFFVALGGLTYHCSFLIQKYLKFSKVTTTEEIHAKELDFPALTVCNLNILKKSFIADQLEKNRNTTFNREKGLTLTLNIERNEYWNLLSPEYGVRIMVHPREAYPTVDRGGIVLHPGTKTYMSIRIREIERLPAPYGDCTKTFQDSPLSELLKNKYDDYLQNHTYYTYEFCQSVCREIHLLQNCKCVEEQVNSTHTFCNPCNQVEETCKEEFKSNFDDNETNACTYLCKPACQDTRYDVTLSTSEWPNLEFQEFVLKRWPELRSDFVESPSDDNNIAQLNETFINPANYSPYEFNSTKKRERDREICKNYLRVHIFVQEMNYLRFMDIEAYSLPELFADLGGCLGLYLGVSLVSIIEFHELLLHIVALFFSKLNRSFSLEDSRTSKLNWTRPLSRSADDLRNINHSDFKTTYDTQLRPEEPTPPIFLIRGKKDGQHIFKVSKMQNITDEETFRRKMCFKCMSDIETLRNSYLYRRQSVKTVSKSVLTTN